MLFEYAVEPQAIGSSWETFRYLIEKFGIDRGRLISRFPNRWEKKVIQAAKEAGLPDIRMASLIERLRSFAWRLADYGRAYDAEKNWIDNALLEHQRAPFHAIIAQQNPENNAAIMPAADIDEHLPLMLVAQDQAVARDAKSIAEALRGLLCIADRIAFVDPFFDPYSSRDRDTFRECLTIVKVQNPRAACEVHYRYHREKPSNTDLEKEAANLFKGVIPEGMSLAVYCWSEKHRGADFHARYLLTERGGIAIDAGFSAVGGHQTTDMHLMSFALSQSRLNALSRPATDYDLVGPVLEVRYDGSVTQI